MSIATSQEATARQASQVLNLVKDAGHDRLQNLIANSDLLKLLLEAPDLPGVDRHALAELLRPKATAISPDWFTPVDELVERIKSRPKSEGFSKRQLDTLRRRLSVHEHAGQYQPVTVDLWYGSLAETRDASISWFSDEARNQGLAPYNYLSGVNLAFFPGSEYSGGRSLSVCGLDLMAHDDPNNGIVPNKVLTTSRNWPGFVVLQFLNLNPQLIPKLGTDEFLPYGLMMPGLVAVSGHVPYVLRRGRHADVCYCWGDDRWYGCALPAFRELRH